VRDVAHRRGAPAGADRGGDRAGANHRRGRDARGDAPRPRRAAGVVAPQDLGRSPRTLVAIILVLGGLAVVIGLSL
jgi:hypothetical protein